jgi:hypothetical protein
MTHNLTDNENTLIEYARTFSDRDLRMEIVEKMNRALEINNTGALRVVDILFDVLKEREGSLDAQFSAFHAPVHAASKPC